MLGFIYLDEDDILTIHRIVLEQHGGQDGVRNHSALSSAVENPKMTWEGKELYPDISSKAAILAFTLAESQVFIDGNKRTAVVAALTFLETNGLEVPEQEERLYDAMMDLATKNITKEDLADLFREIAKPPK